MKEELGEGDIPRRPASIFLVMGSDSKSSESLLLLRLMLLRLTALLGLRSFTSISLEKSLPLEGETLDLASWVKLDVGISSTGEQGTSDTRIRWPVLGSAGGGRNVDEEGGGAAERRASMRSCSSHRPLQLDLCAEGEQEEGEQARGDGVTSASSSASSRRETGGVGGAGMEEVSRGGGMGEKDMALENDIMFMGGGGGVEEAGWRGREAVRPTERTWSS